MPGFLSGGPLSEYREGTEMQIANIWRLFADGKLTEAEAQAADDAIRRPRPAPRPSLPRLRRQRSPDRQASIERRRRLAASGPLPPALAARFTQGETAALRIIGDECRNHGCCELHIDAIAGRAGVCRTTVQNAIREARQGLVTVQERRRRGQRSLTNIIRITSPEWLAWLRHGVRARAVTGFNKKSSTTDTGLSEAPWGVPDGVFPLPP
jgi:hypothetical protein